MQLLHHKLVKVQLLASENRADLCTRSTYTLENTVICIPRSGSTLFYNLGRIHSELLAGVSNKNIYNLFLNDRSELIYLSNRPQVSMVYRLINHAGCW